MGIGTNTPCCNCGNCSYGSGDVVSGPFNEPFTGGSFASGYLTGYPTVSPGGAETIGGGILELDSSTSSAVATMRLVTAPVRKAHTLMTLSFGIESIDGYRTLANQSFIRLLISLGSAFSSFYGYEFYKSTGSGDFEAFLWSVGTSIDDTIVSTDTLEIELDRVLGDTRIRLKKNGTEIHESDALYTGNEYIECQDFGVTVVVYSTSDTFLVPKIVEFKAWDIAWS